MTLLNSYSHTCIFIFSSNSLHQFTIWTVCQGLSVCLGARVLWDLRIKPVRKSIHLVNHSWINHSLWQWSIDTFCSEVPKFPTEPLQSGLAIQQTGSLFNTKVAAVWACAPRDLSVNISISQLKYKQEACLCFWGVQGWVTPGWSASKSKHIIN